jgi:hypothetical protein
MKPAFWIALLLALMYALGFWTGTVYAAERCVAIKVRPTIMLTRGDVDVQVRVQRHDHHRGLSVVWDSEDGYSGSRWFDLEGAQDRVLFQWWNKSQPPAHYIYAARVFDAQGRELDQARIEIQTLEERP